MYQVQQNYFLSDFIHYYKLRRKICLGVFSIQNSVWSIRKCFCHQNLNANIAKTGVNCITFTLIYVHDVFLTCNKYFGVFFLLFSFVFANFEKKKHHLGPLCGSTESPSKNNSAWMLMQHSSIWVFCYNPFSSFGLFFLRLSDCESMPVWITMSVLMWYVCTVF